MALHDRSRSGTRTHEYQKDKIGVLFIANTVILTRFGNDDVALSECTFITRNMEHTRTFNNVINLVRFLMPVNALLLTWLQTVEITEVVRRAEQRHLLHLLFGKMSGTWKIP